MILQKGAKGSEVKKLQEDLIARGYLLPKYGADGVLGDEGLLALKSFAYEHDELKRGAPTSALADPAISQRVLAALSQPPRGPRGVDVAKYQAGADFAKVYASGVRFCFVKATEGKGYVDSSFKTHMAGALGAGLLTGAYHFFHFSSDPSLQAQHFFKTCSSFTSQGLLPPVLDVEETKTPLQASAAWANLQICLQETEKLWGRKPIIYTSARVFRERGFHKLGLDLRAYLLWLARYEVKSPAEGIPDAWKGAWGIWQVGYNNEMPGVPGDIDRNFFNGSLDDLKKLVR